MFFSKNFSPDLHDFFCGFQKYLVRHVFLMKKWYFAVRHSFRTRAEQAEAEEDDADADDGDEGDDGGDDGDGND